MRDQRDEEAKCLCPFCEEEIVVQDYPFCKRCQVSLLYCASCEIAVPRNSERCPQCGGELRWR